MAKEDKDRAFSTVYESEDAGMLAFDRRVDIEGDITAYLAVVNQLKKDFHEDGQIVDGLKEVETKLNALRIATGNKAEVEKKLSSLIKIPVAPGKSIRLDAFRKTASKGTLTGNEEYRSHIRKLVKNTEGNITQLLLTWPEDTILKKFQQDLREIKIDGDINEIKEYMKALGKSPQLWHYDDKKKEFLVEWLRPFQEYFGKPVEELTEKEMQNNIQKVENLRNNKLEEMTHLILEEEHAPFIMHNRRMHPIMNGKNLDFWGSEEVRDEFMGLMNKLLTRFTLNFEDRFLLFKTKDGGFAYLAGFADDALDQAVELSSDKLGISPHLKVFLKNEGGDYSEIVQEAYPGNSSAFYQALKTAAVPFLISMGTMLELKLSARIKDSFDMWI